MRLSEIQEKFKDVMLDLAQLENAEFRTLFRCDTGIGLENRIKVYRNNVIRSLTDAVLAALYGDQVAVERGYPAPAAAAATRKPADRERRERQPDALAQF